MPGPTLPSLIELRDHGTVLGRIHILDITGSGLSPSVSGLVGTLLATAGSSAGLTDHDHTASGDGGVLTNDQHDGYSDWVEISTPANPAANTVRLYPFDENGFTGFHWIDSTGHHVHLANHFSAKVKEATGVTRGMAVYLSGATGAVPEVMLALAGTSMKMPAVGIVADTAALNAFTRVDMFFHSMPFDTSAFSEGDSLYVSATVPGNLTSVMPLLPYQIQRMGVVTRSHAINGEILIVVQPQPITPQTEYVLTLSDNTANDATISRHGLLSKLSGITNSFLSGTGTFKTLAGATISVLDIVNGRALTKEDDVNVTLTLNGSAAVALLAAVGLTLGWTGTLADSRLSLTGVTAGNYGSATRSAVFTVSGTGRLTGVTDTLITSAAPAVAGGRLTLTSATPVLTTTVNDGTSIFYAPYVHDRVPIYDGNNWTMTVFTELTNTTTDSTKNPAAVAASKNYDLFVWSDSGTLRLGRGPAWTSDTARGTGAGTTELERINGVWMNKIAITNGPAADRGTYVGTVRSAADSKIDWQLGTNAANGGEALLNVWNNYNRVDVKTAVSDNTNSWSYSSATIRAANNSATNRVSYVVGQQEDSFEGEYVAIALTGESSVDEGVVGIGYDATNTFAGGSRVLGVTAGGFAGSFFCPSLGSFVTTSLGFHFMSAVEQDFSPSISVTFYGDNGGASWLGQLTFRGRF